MDNVLNILSDVIFLISLKKYALNINAPMAYDINDSNY